MIARELSKKCDNPPLAVYKEVAYSHEKIKSAEPKIFSLTAASPELLSLQAGLHLTTQLDYCHTGISLIKGQKITESVCVGKKDTYI